MADRAFDQAECRVIEERLAAFVSGWAAHGKNLEAEGQLVHSRFLVLTVHEEAHGASGCSIDASVRFIKELEADFNVDFFNRMLVACETSPDTVEVFHTSKLAEAIADGRIGPDTIVYNNLVLTKEAFDTNWRIPLKESIYRRWL